MNKKHKQDNWHQDLTHRPLALLGAKLRLALEFLAALLSKG